MQRGEGFYVLSWPKSSFGFFCNILQKNKISLFGYPVYTVKTKIQLLFQPRECSTKSQTQSFNHALFPVSTFRPLSYTHRDSPPRNRNHVITQGQFAGSIWSLCFLLLFPHSSWYRRFIFLFLVLEFSEQQGKKITQKSY